MSTHISETRIVRGACPQDCPDTCAFLYHVEDGRLVEVTGDPDHPMTRGGLCVKLKDFAEHHYNPNRLLYPMRRVGPKGSGKFERISWDDAYELLVENLRRIAKRFGPEAVCMYTGRGNFELGLNEAFMPSRASESSANAVLFRSARPTRPVSAPCVTWPMG